MAKSKQSNKQPVPKQKAPTKNKFGSYTQLIALALVIGITILCFKNSLNNQWVNWDDDKNFVENPNVMNMQASTFWHYTKEIFQSNVIGGYTPLTTLSFGIEKMLWGMENGSWYYWHWDNLILHLLCVFFVYLLGRQLGLKIWTSAVLALLFGIHPMRVESVAWLTERKDVLFGVFYLAALYFYIRGKSKSGNWANIWIILPLFLLSGLSKIQAVSLPLSMLAVDYLLDKRLSWKTLLSKIPYFAMSLFIGLLGVFLLQSEGTLGATGVHYSFFQRIFIGSYSYLVYLVKFIYPYELVPLYPYPPQFKTIFYLSMLPIVGLIAAVFWLHKKQYKIWVFGVLFFTFNIMFLLQIVGAGQGFIADRFTYIAYFGLFFIVAYCLNKLDVKKMSSKIIIAVLALYLGFLGYLTSEQCKVWTNSYSMWTHVIKYYPNTKVPWGNRANWLRDNNYKVQALQDYNKRISLGQDEAEPFNSRGRLFFNSSHPDTLRLAKADYQKAIELAEQNPKKYKDKSSEYYVNLGSTLARLKDYRAAIQAFNRAEQLDANNKQVFFNRSITHHFLGDYNKELKDIESYLKYDPYHAGLLVNRGTCKRLLGDFVGAEQAYNYAEKYTQIPNLYVERARNYLNLNQPAKAMQDVRKLRDKDIRIPEDLKNALKL